MTIYKENLVFFKLLKNDSNIIALDVGLKKIGIAICPVNSPRIPTPLTTLIRKNKEKDVEAISSIVQEWNVSGFVLGDPLNSDRTVNTESRKKIDQLARWLSENFSNIPLTLMDESYSTQMAHSIMLCYNVDAKSRHKNDDSIAACIILESLMALWPPNSYV